MKNNFIWIVAIIIAVTTLNACSKEKSIDSTTSSGTNVSDQLKGDWKLLYITSSGHEEGAYTLNGATYKEVYDFKDSTTNNNGTFSFTKDSLLYTIAYNESGKDWDYYYQNAVLVASDSSVYNDPVADAGRIPYIIKGDSITLVDNAGYGIFGGGIPVTYKYVLSGDKLTLLGQFNFMEKDTLTNYVETYNVNLKGNIYLQKK